MQFAVLGPLQVSVDGRPVGLGGPKQRALLALLLLHANTVVSRDRLVDGLWGERPPPSAAGSLDVYLSRLRKLIGRDRLVRHSGGYLLRVAPGELDTDRFEHHVTAARQAADAARAVRELAAALALWRGPALADLAYEPFAQTEIRRLEQQRLTAVEDQIEAELALGQHASVCPELEQLVAEHPLRERLRGQLMLALYRSGRQAEALAVFGDTRRVLDAELGIGPSPALRLMHKRVLAADPWLDPPAPAGAAAVQALPQDIASFTGRERELAQLLGAVDSQAANGVVVGVHAIDGMAGIGKTAFAVHAAHRLAPGFPDGQFFLPLHAHTAGHHKVDPADALASLLLTAGLTPLQIPPGVEARAARWRDHVAGKKVLLVLDDVAGHEQVRPLLPGTAGSLVLITSRRRLAAVQDAAVISLDTLPPGEAAVLLAGLAARPGLGAGDAAVGELTRLCGYLPLAIGMIASQLRHHRAWTAAGLAAELAAARDRPALMRAEDLSVAAAFGLSYTDLTAGQQRLFSRLGLVPGPSIDAYAAAALDGTSLATARRHLEDLYDQHLLTEPAPGRYQLHDLLREHARTLAAADGPAETRAATGRLLDYYLHTASAAQHGRGGRPVAFTGPPPNQPPAEAPDLSAREQANAWLDTERANLHAAAVSAAASGWLLHAVRIPAAIKFFLVEQGHWDQAAELYRLALSAAHQADDRPGQAFALTQLGFLAAVTADYPGAVAHLAQAAQLYRGIDDQAGLIEALRILGEVQREAGDYPAAAASHQEALVLARGLGDRRSQAGALNSLGDVQTETGDYPAAAASQQQALALSRETGHPIDQAEALISLGIVRRETGDYPAAAASLQRALTLWRDHGDPSHPGPAIVLNELGLVYQRMKDYPRAAASLQQALDHFRDSRFRIGQAKALNSLGEQAFHTMATHQARDYHGQALAIALDIGAPLQEARALEGIGHSHLHDGHATQAAPYLHQALAIYQRIGSPHAQRVQHTLRQHQP